MLFTKVNDNFILMDFNYSSIKCFNKYVIKIIQLSMFFRSKEGWITDNPLLMKVIMEEVNE